jgi:hypothetical protein
MADIRVFWGEEVFSREEKFEAGTLTTTLQLPITS